MRQREKKRKTFSDSTYLSAEGIKKKVSSHSFLTVAVFFSINNSFICEFFFYLTGIQPIHSIYFIFSLTNLLMATAPTPNVTTIEQLSVNNPSFVSDPNDPSENVFEDDILPPMKFDRQSRPQSSRTTHSTTSRSSVNNLDGRVSCHDYHATKYFSYKVNFIRLINIQLSNMHCL
jgi:hypothetical protein